MTYLKTVICCAALVAACVPAQAKVYTFEQWARIGHHATLANTDSFGLECLNNRTGAIDLLLIDADAGTVTVYEGDKNATYTVDDSSVAFETGKSQFNEDMYYYYASFIQWRHGSLTFNGSSNATARYYFHHDDGSASTCAFPQKSDN
jgi:hypothetical protein